MARNFEKLLGTELLIHKTDTFIEFLFPFSSLLKCFDTLMHRAENNTYVANSSFTSSK